VKISQFLTDQLGVKQSSSFNHITKLSVSQSDTGKKTRQAQQYNVQSRKQQ